MGIEFAISNWQGVLGSEFVLSDPSHLEAAETATFATQQRIPVILRPADRLQVQACLEIANRYQTPIYPISSGKNWGYGSRVPVADGCALLDLGRLNRIVNFDEDLAYVTVEPGVTQRQLYTFLQQQGSRLWMDATGFQPRLQYYWQHLRARLRSYPLWGSLCPSVRIRSGLAHRRNPANGGLGRFDNAKATPVYRWGVGPYLDGLFTQSNLGIVTQMTVWLMPAPEYFQAFYFGLRETKNLSTLINVLRPLAPKWHHQQRGSYRQRL